MHLKKFSLNFSSWSCAIRVNLLHPQPSLFPFWFIITSLVFFYLIKLIFCGFLRAEGYFARRRKRLKYHELAPLNNGFNTNIELSLFLLTNIFAFVPHACIYYYSTITFTEPEVNNHFSITIIRAAKFYFILFISSKEA